MAHDILEHAPVRQAPQGLLEEARAQAGTDKLPYAGRLAPLDAWRLVEAGAAVLVDVRSAEERHFVGHVPGSVHVPWATGTSLTRNPRFLKELESRAGQPAKTGKPLLLLCRSGKRSAAAADFAARAGLGEVYNVLEGFEGDLDASGQRGHFNGWRFHALPWVQD
jgi:rhodanese-related sulfurtransferase